MSIRVLQLPLVLFLASSMLVFPRTARAAEDKKDSGKLPIEEIVLFNSGVGYFEHRGNVEGDDQVDLPFRVDNINDLLKSMVLQDLGGGSISTVSYGSRDPITRTLKTFAIDLTDNPTLDEILVQLRGQQVEIDAPNPIAGTIVGVEKRKRRVEPEDEGDGHDKLVEVAYLNLLTEGGLRSVSLDLVGRIRLIDPKLDQELREALKVLATAHDLDRKTVTLNFLGKGKRPVRVGYIQESPIWKTSYRLVLDERGAPLLQGWAIVENTTDQDWKDVSLTLVSGRPISFVMDLYSPLYASRPVVQQELYGSLRPPTYDQDLAARDKDFRRGAQEGGGFGGMPPAPTAGMPGMRGGMHNLKSRAAEMADMAQPEAKYDAFDPSQGVDAAATAADVGELFRYQIATPVTLQRQRSAMLPIINDHVKGEKLSIYNQAVHAKHPLNGLKLVNTSKLHLMQGPVTVYDAGVYAGDAKFTDLPPGSERLISYAMDLDVEVAPHSVGKPEELLSVRLAKGTLYVSRKFRRSTTYTIKNSDKKERRLLIEQPLDPAWTLVVPKEPTEKTRDMYRFAVNAKPGMAETLEVEQQRVENEQVLVTNLDDYRIGIFLSAKTVSDQVKKALQEVVRRQAELNNVVRNRVLLEQQIQVIDQEQSRIRENMARVPQNTDLFKRYLAKFTEQEDQVEKLRSQIDELKATENRKRQELDTYLLSLDLK